MSTYPPRAPQEDCGHCGHALKVHAPSTGCSACLPGVDCAPEPEPIEAWPDGRGPGSAEVIELRDVEVQPGESICAQCWLVHRPGLCEAS